MPFDAKTRPYLFQHTLLDLDETKLFPTDESRHQALKEASEELKPFDIFLGMSFIIACVTVAYFATKFALRIFPFTIPRFPAEALPFIVAGITVPFLITFVHRWGVRTTLRKKLIAAHVPICIKCGYLLRGLQPDKPACPECGRAIDANIRTILTNEQRPNLPA